MNEKEFFESMRDLGIPEDLLKDIKLPGPNTPLPPTNATLHVLDYETGYGTKQRRFHAMCGVSWAPGDGGHKYFFSGEYYWFKHLTCEKCKELVTPKQG